MRGIAVLQNIDIALCNVQINKLKHPTISLFIKTKQKNTMYTNYGICSK